MKNVKHLHGFNLIEAAIVLGVVGLVIGGIWVAAASVMEKNKIRRQTEVVMAAVAGARQVFSSVDYPTTDISSYWATPTLYAAGHIPAQYSVYDICCHATTEFGRTTNMGVTIWKNTSDFPGIGHGIVVAFENLKLSECINLSASIGGRASNTSMAALSIGSASYIRTFPADMDTISTNCRSQLSGGLVTVGYWFKP